MTDAATYAFILSLVNVAITASCFGKKINPVLLAIEVVIAIAIAVIDLYYLKMVVHGVLAIVTAILPLTVLTSMANSFYKEKK